MKRVYFGIFLMGLLVAACSNPADTPLPAKEARAIEVTLGEMTFDMPIGWAVAPVTFTDFPDVQPRIVDGALELPEEIKVADIETVYLERVSAEPPVERIALQLENLDRHSPRGTEIRGDISYLLEEMSAPDYTPDDDRDNIEAGLSILESVRVK